jgi:site-specific DNA recombinase
VSLKRFGELKKGRYVYYHCTGYKGKCGEPYVREEVIAKKFTDVLGQLHFGDDVLSWITKALRESHADEQMEHETAIGRLQAEYSHLQRRMHAMYVDKLDGRIDNSFYVQMSEQWKLEQDKLAREIARHQTADRSYLDEGAGLIELAHGARSLFAKQEPREQRRLLDFVLSNSTWKNGELTPTFRQPFDLIAEVTTNAKVQEDTGALHSPEHPVWLGN